MGSLWKEATAAAWQEIGRTKAQSEVNAAAAADRIRKDKDSLPPASRPHQGMRVKNGTVSKQSQADEYAK